VIKSLGGNVKILVTSPKEEEEAATKKKDGECAATLNILSLYIVRFIFLCQFFVVILFISFIFIKTKKRTRFITHRRRRRMTGECRL
jgi:hypothetical protein